MEYKPKYKVGYETRKQGAIGVWSITVFTVYPDHDTPESAHDKARQHAYEQGLEVRYPVNTVRVTGTTHGTNHFESFEGAMLYYKPYGYENVRKTVERKISEGEIAIGRPPAKPGQRVFLHEEERRYFVEDSP